MVETRIRGAALLLAILMIPGCAAKTSSELAGIDQEITRNILWRYHQDPGNRFKEIRVTCEFCNTQYLFAPEEIAAPGNDT